MKSFTYLGQVITTEENKTFTEHRINSANAKFNELRTVLCDPNVNLRSRRKFLYSSVRSRIAYGTQACYPKEHELKQLEGCWHELLRSMVRGGWSRRTAENPDDVEYAFRYTNNDIQRILKTTPLRDFVNEQYLKYIAHVSRMDNNAIPKKIS